MRQIGALCRVGASVRDLVGERGRYRVGVRVWIRAEGYAMDRVWDRARWARR